MNSLQVTEEFLNILNRSSCVHPEVKCIYGNLKSHKRHLEELFKKYDTKWELFLDSHFGDIINDIDIFTEIKIDKAHKNNEPIDAYNKTRHEYLTSIESFKTDCITNLRKNTTKDYDDHVEFLKNELYGHLDANS